MKKLLALLLACVMCLGLCACGGKEITTEDYSSEENVVEDDSIELTLDNYQDYLNLDMSVGNYGKSKEITDGSFNFITYGYEEVMIQCNVTGASSNYNYNDVVLTVAFEGTYDAFAQMISKIDTSTTVSDIPFECEISVNTNIAGDGDDFYIIEAEDNNEWFMYTNKDYFVIDAEVVDISGSVTPVK